MWVDGQVEGGAGGCRREGWYNVAGRQAGMKCCHSHSKVLALLHQLLSLPHCPSLTTCVFRLAGEEALSEEPPEGMFKPVAEPNQLDNMLLSNQMASYCQHINSATQQALSKLTLMEGLQKAL